jgi:hypothetical protein
MSGRHPLIAFLAGLPQFEDVSLQDCVVELRTGCVVSKHEPPGEGGAGKFLLDLRWPGMSDSTSCHVDAYTYLALQVQEAAKLGFDMKLSSESAARAIVEASEWRPEM